MNGYLAVLLLAALLGGQATTASQLRDYSASGVDQTCANVKIVEASEGIIRSPFYYDGGSGKTANRTALKCKWTLIAPAGQTIELTLVDYERENKGGCSESGRLDFKNLVFDKPAANATDTEQPPSLLMPFYEYDAAESKMNRKLLRLNKNMLSSCSFNFQPFTVLSSTTNVVQIEYEASEAAAFDFFLTFKLVKPSGKTQDLNETDQEPFCSKPDEIRCQIDYNLAGFGSPAPPVQLYSCIHKDVLCNCLDASAALSSAATPATSGILYDNCDYLMKHYRVYLDFLIKRPADYCHFYQNLNRKCRKNEPDAEDGSDDDVHAQAPSSIVDQPDADQNLEDYESDEGDAVPSVKQAAALNDGLIVDNANASASSKAAQELCRDVIRANNYGWIASPNFNLATNVVGNKYPDNLTCGYHITVKNGSSIQVRFKYYYLNPIFISVPVSRAGANNKSELSPPTPRERRSLTGKLYKRPLLADMSESARKFQFLSERSIDYDYINIYDGTSAADPLLVHLTASQNDYMARNINAKVFNSRTNTLFVVFHSQMSTPANQQQAKFTSPVLGFNFTYQVKGECVEDQVSCNSPYDAECYAKSQRCNDVWDCHNGEDEKGCGPCPYDQYWCRNHIFCYRQQDRCDGDHQCIDKSDEMNCDAWLCNSANGTFLCKNGRCIYEQWVCDGQADCDDGSDEDKCPTPLTRRVITTAVVGGTLCCLLLVMALGCACKLYTLHTVGYRTNARLSQSVQTAAAAAAATAPLIPRSSTTMTTLDPSSMEPATSAGFLSSLLRRTGSEVVDGVPTTVHSLPQSALLGAAGQQLPPPPPPPPTTIMTGAGELPLPHHLIAPPTYNQTMGLVDEYEQRQLAFIEHVRSILTQQQQQQQQQSSAASGSSGQPNAATIPLVTTGSTTLHRVTSNTGYRRSHSSRHHRHHHHHHHHSGSGHHHSSGSRASAQQTGSDTAANAVTGSGSSSRHGAHRHHSQSHSSRQNHDANRRGLAMLNEPPAEAAQSQAPPPRRSSANVTTPSAMSTSFSSAISSGQTQLGTPLTFNLNGSTTTPAPPSNNVPMMPLVSSADHHQSSVAAPAPSSSSSLAQQANTFNSLVNKTSNASTNLRDRIAKLIKDIVVHHGDNIQYVQLADQLNQQSPAAAAAVSPLATTNSPVAAAQVQVDMNGESVSLSSTNSNLSVCLTPEVSVDLSTPGQVASAAADPPSSGSMDDAAAPARQSSETPSTSSAESPSTTSDKRDTSTAVEDDVPLIQA